MPLVNIFGAILTQFIVVLLLSVNDTDCQWQIHYFEKEAKHRTSEGAWIEPTW